jgi:phosphatidylserine/phosphatidylglycerophosphate/cardiolipin synthase-like enzyme
VQAYWLTSPVILRAIAGAKRRGLDVAAILDKTQDRHSSERSRYTGATYLANAGVPVWIDDAPAIAHNKVIILDGATVITGSFNFTKSADTRNAENVVTIGSRDVAAWFTRNWEERRAASRAFGEE